MAKGEGEYTDDKRFIEAFRKFNKYDDKWVNDWFEFGDVLEKADTPGSDNWDKDFQGDMGG